IGLAHAARGAPADAVTPLRAAWATRDATLGPEHPDTIRAALALGTVEADVGLPAAQDRLREAVQRSPARDDPLYRTAVDRLSGLLLSAGDVAAAEPLVRAAWETHRGTPASEESVRVAERLARIELSRGRRGEAALLLEGVLASAAGRAADEATVLEHHATLARIYRDLDRPAAAMPHARFVLESRQRSSGDDDDATLDALDEVARLELDLGRAAEAERLFVKSLSIRERRHGRAAPAVLAVQDEIALVTLVRGRSEEAIDRCRATIALRQAAGTDEGWRAAFTRSTLGAALATSPQHRAEGEPLLREACLHLGDVDSAPPRVRRWACGWLERLGL
ncbi:MAG: tetratricopeptide repeat protein, partial [Phycisphaerae bacterium]|nr:tetratricopeptide repeat protein [Phycisphaerae bacterium]